MMLISFFVPFILSNGNGYIVELESTTRWEPIRIFFDIQIENEDKKSIIKQTTDSISSYLKKLLKVHPCKYIKTIKFNEFTEKTINSIDLYILITSLPEGDDAAASTQTYIDLQNDFRPKASIIKLGLQNVIKPSTINDNPRDLFEILIHEVFHALGLSQGLFGFWIEPESGQQYIWLEKNPTYSCNFEGIKREFTFVTTKNIKEFIKRKYGDDDFGIMSNGQICEAGIELEDDGGEGSKGKHPELRVFPYEIMGAFHKSKKFHSISDMTLTLLNSTGFYQVNFDMAEPYSFGYPETNNGNPIKKFMYGIPSKTWPEQYQCNPERYNIDSTATSFQVCNPDLRSIAQCNRYKYECPRDSEICNNLDFIDPYGTGYSGTSHDTDYISFPEPLRSCSQPLTDDIDYIRYGSTVGENSVCLVSNARNKESGWYNPEMLTGRCFNIECDEKFTQYTVYLADGGKGTCYRAGQNLTFPDSKYKYGHIECTDPYWTCYAMNNHHSYDYVPPSDTDDGGDSDDTTEATTEAVETIEPEPTPVPDPGPTTDASYSTESSQIKFTRDGFAIGDNEEIKTKSSTAEIIMLKVDGLKISVDFDTENEPSQKRYISPITTGAVLTINKPSGNGDYGHAQIGVHGNGYYPSVKIPTAKIPLNFYSNETSFVEVTLYHPIDLNNHDPKEIRSGDEDEEVDSYSLGNILSQGGELLLSVPIGVTQIEFNEITVFNGAKIDSVSGVYSNPITTVVDSLNLNKGANVAFTKIVVNSKLTAKINSKMTVISHASFGNESVISLSHLSSINFGDSIIDGVPKSISAFIESASSSRMLEDDEENLICGDNFECSEWLTKFTPSNDFNEAKCVNTTQGQECLVAIKNNNNSNNKNKKKTVIIAVVVVVVVVVIAAVVVAVIFIMKKKKNMSSTNLNETNQTNDADFGI